MVHLVGDYLGGILTGAATALVVRAVTYPGMDMVVAMVLGMAVGMVVHLLLGLLLAPILGMFHTMIPGSLIGMYGGMFFGMRDSMSAGSATWIAAITVGGLFGAATVLAVQLYDRAVHGVVFDAEP